MKKILLLIFIICLPINLFSQTKSEPSFLISYNNITWDNNEEILPPEVIAGRNILLEKINSNFKGIISSSQLFVLDSQNEAAVNTENLTAFSLSPEITEAELIETKHSGYFFKLSINIEIKNINNSKTNTMLLASLGSGVNIREAIDDTIDGIVTQFEYLLYAYEEWADSFRIIDIYHGTAVVNAGKNKKIRKGQFLYSIDHNTGKKSANFVIDGVEEKLSYAKILDTKIFPEAGDSLRSSNLFGVTLTGNADYFLGPDFTGFSGGAHFIWNRWLYIFHPLVGVDFFLLKDADSNKLNLLTPYIGFRMIRYIGSFSFSSTVGFGIGYLLESDLPEVKKGFEYWGGLVKIRGEKKIIERLGIYLEAGYSYWFPEDWDNYPDIAGFLLGGGIEVKF